MSKSHPEALKTVKALVSVLDRVPAHWRKMSLSFATSSRCDGPFGSGIKSEHYKDSGVRVIRLQNIKSGYFRDVDSSSAFLDAEYVAASLSGHDVVAGDVLIAGLGDQNNLVGRSCTAPSNIGPALVKADCFRFRLLRSMADPRFVALQLSATAVIDSRLLASGSTRSRIPLSQMSRRKIGLPPMSEQKAVVAFVEHEAGQIDILIDKQKKLIDLLKEKRQAVISQAVTKGLDPDVPMKDSGVEWLGKVPRSWSVGPVKHFLKVPMTDGPHETPEFIDTGIPFVSAEAVSKGKINFRKIRGFISIEEHAKYSSKYKPKKGDVFIVKSGATTGVSAIVESDIDFNIWSPLAALRSNQLIRPKYLLCCVRSRSFLESIELHWNYGTQQNIGMGSLENLPICVPALDEQDRIVRRIEEIEGWLGELLSRAKAAIKFAEERRAALITAAVTGQIDVTNYAPTEPAAA